MLGTLSLADTEHFLASSFLLLRQEHHYSHALAAPLLRDLVNERLHLSGILCRQHYELDKWVRHVILCTKSEFFGRRREFLGSMDHGSCSNKNSGCSSLSLLVRCVRPRHIKYNTFFHFRSQHILVRSHKRSYHVHRHHHQTLVL